MGSVTEVAAPGAETRIRRSRGPVLTSPTNMLAELPAGRVKLGTPPRMNALRIAISPPPAMIVADAPLVGGCQFRIGASPPASHPASTGISATAATAQARRRAFRPGRADRDMTADRSAGRLRGSITCSPRIRVRCTWDARKRIGTRRVASHRAGCVADRAVRPGRCGPGRCGAVYSRAGDGSGGPQPGLAGQQHVPPGSSSPCGLCPCSAFMPSFSCTPGPRCGLMLRTRPSRYTSTAVSPAGWYAPPMAS